MAPSPVSPLSCGSLCGRGRGCGLRSLGWKYAPSWSLVCFSLGSSDLQSGDELLAETPSPAPSAVFPVYTLPSTPSDNLMLTLEGAAWVLPAPERLLGPPTELHPLPPKMSSMGALFLQYCTCLCLSISWVCSLGLGLEFLLFQVPVLVQQENLEQAR